MDGIKYIFLYQGYLNLITSAKFWMGEWIENEYHKKSYKILVDRIYFIFISFFLRIVRVGSEGWFPNLFSTRATEFLD